MATVESDQLRAIVDMGSNGVRFSITDLSPETARTMPTVLQDRAGISLYDAQWKNGQKQPISQLVVDQVVANLKHFQRTCREFGVKAENVRVLATEATREATNSAEFREAIRSATGWTVEMLPKEEEGLVGAMGVASSFTSISGLVMDLGGGSTQLTWLDVSKGEIRLGKSVSLPLGAAALSRRMEEAEKNGTLRHLRNEIEATIAETVEQLDTLGGKPVSERKHIPLLLSGGGFRGWGYTLMDMHSNGPYPIPIINGFTVQASEFRNTDAIKRHADSNDVFRISERRSEQVPAVAFLVQALTATLHSISYIRFCQGGVREGALFSSLAPEVRMQKPITVASSRYAPQSHKALRRLLQAAVPASHLTDEPIVPLAVTAVLDAFVNMLYVHGSLPKEGRAPAALRSTTAGLLAGAHGLIHEERAALALMLCQRWGGEVSPTDDKFFHALESVAGPEVSWWTAYFGRVGALIGDVYPAGKVPDGGERLQLDVRSIKPASSEAAGHGKPIKKITLVVSFPGLAEHEVAIYEKAVAAVQKVGKRKNWVGGRVGWGIKVKVETAGQQREDSSGEDEQ